MGKVIWSPNALDDVDSIAEFIAQDSIQRASLFALKIINATNKLQDFPLSGRIIPEINELNMSYSPKKEQGNKVEKD